MSYRHDEIGDDLLDHPREREFTLSTGTVLAIFFGLALICGAFFAFGFNMGSKARPVPVPAVAEAPGSAVDFGRFKPSSGAPAAQPVQGSASQKEADATGKPGAGTDSNTLVTASSPHTVATQASPRDSDLPATPTAPIVRTPLSPVHVASATADPLATGSFMVQVAAVTHPEDAELLIGALKRKGYSVAARNEPQDRLVHIQVGPFASKKDADTMRQRLLADGYNAIVK